MIQEVVKITLQHDISLAIATASSRKAVKWANKSLTWGEFVSRTRNVTRTQETLEEYGRMSKAEQGEIKDVGGFVGGSLKGGRRTAENVAWRSFVTLDADYVKGDFWSTASMMFEHASMVYSTHSHTSKNPRLRFIFPLTRPVSPEEYVAVSRRIAADIGIDMFDDTTFEPHRLMYWPSASRGAEFIHEFQDAPILNPEEVLARYTDWRNPEEWPLSSRAETARARMTDKQGDPLTRPGLIGLFNRSYNIHEAIEKFLPEIYTAESDGRYTYVGGSTVGGLVVYDDIFAYSHHGTDRISGQLVNAYDLVRLHKFGAMDEDAKDGTPVNRLPSTKEMQGLVRHDDRVKESMLTEKLLEAESDFGDVIDVKEDSNAWVSQLDVGQDGNIDQTRKNILTILTHDPKLKGKFALNEFSHRAVVTGDLPWRKILPGQELLNDYDDAGLRNYLETVYGISNLQKTQDALAQTLYQNGFHPVKEYLDGVTWDGESRVDTLFIQSLGAEDSELNRQITRKTLVAAVARIYEPGCKMDYMLTFVGAQGVGKSSLANRLGKDWFSDSLTTVTGKEAYEQLQGAWIVEMGELSAMRKSDVESTKHFLTKRIDRFRVAYGKHVADFPRQCIFIGSTNDNEFLSDHTGNRRFWVMPTGKNEIVKEWNTITDAEIDQIWAEAVHHYKEGEKLYLDSEIEKDMFELQAGHSQQSPLVGMIEEHLAKPVPVGFETLPVDKRREFFNGPFNDVVEDSGAEKVVRDRICALEIWVELLNRGADNFPQQSRREIGNILQNLKGWKVYDGNKQGRLRFGPDIGLQKAYVRKQDYNI